MYSGSHILLDETAASQSHGLAQGALRSSRQNLKHTQRMLEKMEDLGRTDCKMDEFYIDTHLLYSMVVGSGGVWERKLGQLPGCEVRRQLKCMFTTQTKHRKPHLEFRNYEIRDVTCRRQVMLKILTILFFLSVFSIVLVALYLTVHVLTVCLRKYL